MTTMSNINMIKFATVAIIAVIIVNMCVAIFLVKSQKPMVSKLPEDSETIIGKLSHRKELVLNARNTRVSINVGETVYLKTRTGFMTMMKPSNPGWDEVFKQQSSLAGSSQIVSYNTQYIDMRGLKGVASFEHRFTGVKPGVSTFTKTRGAKLVVTVSGRTK